MKKLLSKLSRFKISLLVITGVLLAPNIVLAQDSLKGLAGLLGHILLWVINGLAANILLPLINLLVKIVSYNDFLGSRAVEVGWPLVRDVSNMFFVVFLLVIAFSTILKVSKYHYKTALFKLILMAILINFSKTIMGFLIDFGQVIMLTFVIAFRDAAANNLVNAFGLAELAKIPSDPNNPQGAIQNWEVLGSLILDLIMVIVAIGVMLAYVAVLLYRIIALWILVILSPLAFLLSAFDGTAKYASEIWSKFWSQLTTGIILAFFLWLALSIIAFGFNADGGLNTVSQLSQWDRFFSFIVAIALLLTALQFAQQAGGFAGAFAGKVSGSLSALGTKATRVATFPFRKVGQATGFGVKQGVKLAERKLLDFSTDDTRGKPGFFRKKLKYMTKAGWEGYMKRPEELLSASRASASAYAHDEANRIFANIETSHGQNEFERQSKQSAEDYSVSGLEDLKNQIQDILKMKPGKERHRRLNGLLSTASLEAWMDDIESIPHILDELMTGDESNEVNKRKAKKAEITSKYNSDKHVADTTAIVMGSEEMKGATKEEVKAEVEAQIKIDIDNEMKKEFGKADPMAAVELTGEQKQGRFFDWLSRGGSLTGKQSQETLHIIYNHEKNAVANGHGEDVGFVRAAEKDSYYQSDVVHQGKTLHKKGELSAKKGDLQILDYINKGVDGLTETTRMRLTELGKIDPKKLIKFQKHSFAPVMADGSLGSPTEGYRAFRQIVGGADEVYKLTLNGRASNQEWGSSATVNPKFEFGEGKIPIVKLDENWKDVLQGMASSGERKAKAGAYMVLGSQFLDEKGKKLDAREAPKNDGYMLMKTIDKERRDIVAGINILTGKMVKFKEGINDKGEISLVADVSTKAGIEEFARKNLFKGEGFEFENVSRKKRGEQSKQGERGGNEPGTENFIG